MLNRVFWIASLAYSGVISLQAKTHKILVQKDHHLIGDFMAMFVYVFLKG